MIWIQQLIKKGLAPSKADFNLCRDQLQLMHLVDSADIQRHFNSSEKFSKLFIDGATVLLFSLPSLKTQIFRYRGRGKHHKEVKTWPNKPLHDLFKIRDQLIWLTCKPSFILHIRMFNLTRLKINSVQDRESRLL